MTKKAATTSKRSSAKRGKSETRKRNAKLERFAPVTRKEREPILTSALRKLKSASVAELYEHIGGDGTFPTPRSVYNALHHFAGDWPDSDPHRKLYEQTNTGDWTLRKASRVAQSSKRNVSRKRTKAAA